MRSLRLVLSITFVLLVIGAGAYFVVKNRAIPAGQDAVTLELETAIFPTQEGEPINLDDLKARIRIINFWASWSPSSVEELNSFARLEKAYVDDVKIIAINRDTTKEEGFAFLDSKGLSGKLLYLYDSADMYYKELGGYNMPETVFINQNGEVLTRVRGPMTYESMESTVQELLAR